VSSAGYGCSSPNVIPLKTGIQYVNRRSGATYLLDCRFRGNNSAYVRSARSNDLTTTKLPKLLHKSGRDVCTHVRRCRRKFSNGFPATASVTFLDRFGYKYEFVGCFPTV
jgi:hypothetical protein